MIPAFNLSGVLPPFLGGTPTDPGGVAPYDTNTLEIAMSLAASAERIDILKGLIAYRTELKNAGIQNGFQWIDGSFVEDVEGNRLQTPRDIDVVTFAERPADLTDPGAWNRFVNTRRDLFYPPVSKTTYKCDAYFSDLNLPPPVLISRSSYWFGLFSHQRASYLWKGLLQISLQDDDSAALAYLNRGGSNAQ